MDDKTKALVGAAEKAITKMLAADDDNLLPAVQSLRLACAAFNPEVEWEYVLPEFYSLPMETRTKILDTKLTETVADAKAFYDRTRELTKVPRGREWWLWNGLAVEDEQIVVKLRNQAIQPRAIASVMAKQSTSERCDTLSHSPPAAPMVY